jgi:hypothetical protein
MAGLNKFTMGQRVMVKPENLCGTIHVGYYGHVVRIEVPNEALNRYKQPLYHVYLCGRSGQESCWWMLSETEGYNPFGFFEDELEATD